MKNFFAGLKTSLNTIYPGAQFSEETTESEVLDFLGTQEGETVQAVQTLEAVTAESSEDIANLTTALGAVVEAQKAQNDLISAMQADVKKVQTSLNAVSAKLVVPKDTSGGDAPGKPKQDGNTFETESRSEDIMKAARLLLGK